MSIRGKACIAGIYEHPTRHAPDKSVAELHAEVAAGALADAGIIKADVDGYFCAGDAPGLGGLSMIDYLGLKVRHVDSTETGGSSYIVHVAHAAEAIAAGRCSVALITLAGRPRSEGSSGLQPRFYGAAAPDAAFEQPYGPATVNMYAMVAMRHMYEFGTTSEQLAWIKVAASHHAQHNPRAMLRDVVTVKDVLDSPMIADPLHRLDCCVVSDGGGALVVTRPEIARELKKPLVRVIGAGEAVKGQSGGKLDLTRSASAWSGAAAFAEAGVGPADIRYASIYDSFTVTVLVQLEDLGFCAAGEGGRFVADGSLVSGSGRLAVNTDGGGLCNNHPANRGGMTKVIEAVRQLRGEDASRGAGEGLRARARQRHGRPARFAPLRGHSDPRARMNIPSPAVNPENKPFFDAAREGRLLIKRCLVCGERHYYPRAHCPFCGSQRTEWIESRGRGRIYSFSVMRRVAEPYAIAYVTLDEGVSMLTNLVDCQFDQLKIGAPVRVVFRSAAGGEAIPMFMPL